MQYSLNYSSKRVLSTEIKITQFPGGFRLKYSGNINITRIAHALYSKYRVEH